MAAMMPEFYQRRTSMSFRVVAQVCAVRLLEQYALVRESCGVRARNEIAD